MKERSKVNSSAEKELDKAEKQFEAFDANVKELTLDRMRAAPKEESEPQTRLSSRELSKMPDHYLKPHKTIGCKEKFNEKYREAYEYAKVYVPFIAENKESPGDTIDIWTRPFAGLPAQEWLVPTGKPVWGPRFLAEQIKSKRYSRLVMKENNISGGDHAGQYFGTMAADTQIQRLDANPVNQSKSVFVGAGDF